MKKGAPRSRVKADKPPPADDYDLFSAPVSASGITVRVKPGSRIKK